MTWEQFKAAVEQAGVKGHDELQSIVWTRDGRPPVEVERDRATGGVVIY